MRLFDLTMAVCETPAGCRGEITWWGHYGCGIDVMDIQEF